MADSEDLVCNACSFSITTAAQRASHYKSEWHRYNVKRRCAGLPPIDQEIFTQKLSTLQQQKRVVAAAGTAGRRGADESLVAAALAAGQNKQKCNICDKTFSGENAYKAHLNSKGHQKKASKPSASASVSSSSSASASSSPDVVESLENMRISAESKKAKDDTEEDDDGLGEIPEDREAIPLKSCLFCSKSFDTLEKSLDHMLKMHGFFIPFIEYLVDLEGLLTYLGEKVGLGCICLYCNGRGRAAYPSLHAVRQHMAAKSHCKIRFEEDEDDDEFVDFYNFPTQGGDDEDEGEEEGDEKEDEKTNEAANSEDDVKERAVAVVVPKRGLSRMGDNSELVLTDGSVIGHRSFNVYYRQNLRTGDNRESVVTALMSQYRALALPGYEKKQTRNERTKHFEKARFREQFKAERRANFQEHFHDQTGAF